MHIVLVSKEDIFNLLMAFINTISLQFLVRLDIANERIDIKVPVPESSISGQEDNQFRYVETDYQNKLLTEIVQSYAVGDLCLIGEYR